MRSIPHTSASLFKTIGMGLLAGFAGTVAMNISKKIEEKITGKKRNNATVEAVKKVFDIQPSKNNEELFTKSVVYGYGSANEIFRSGLALAGIKGLSANALHYAIICTTIITLEPMLDVAPPITERNPGEVAAEFFHHAVYAIVTGIVFDALTPIKN